MDDEDYEEVEEIRAMPLVREDLILPFVQATAAMAHGIGQALDSFRATLVSASIYRSEQKMQRARIAADRHRMEQTAKELQLLDASAFEERD